MKAALAVHKGTKQRKGPFTPLLLIPAPARWGSRELPGRVLRVDTRLTRLHHPASIRKYGL